MSLKFPSGPKLDKLRWKMSRPSVEDPVPAPAQHKLFSVSSNGKIPTDQPKCSKAPPVFDFKTSRLMKEKAQIPHTPEERLTVKEDAKPRSRSLIRRSSKKVKQKINEVKSLDECAIN